MKKHDKIFDSLTKEERKIFKKHNSPRKIQDFIQSLKINFELNGETSMSPRSVMKNKMCHCMEGAILAAAMLRFHGYPALIVDLEAHKGDYDHALAVFKKDGFWGAITKTNHSVLRYRDPIYKSVRELVMTYFHEYFLDKDGKKTMRRYSNPINLKRFDKLNWVTTDEELWPIAEYIADAPHIDIVNRSQIAQLRPADFVERSDANITEYKDPLKRKDQR